MQAKKGGLYWGRVTDEAVSKLKDWDIVILNDSNTWNTSDDMTASGSLKRIRDLQDSMKPVGISFNNYSVFVSTLDWKPSIYYGAQIKIYEAAERLGAWIMIDGKHLSQYPSTYRPYTWLFDLRNIAFRKELATIVNTYCKQLEPDFVFLDENHGDLTFLRSDETRGLSNDDPRVKEFIAKLPTKEEWTAAQKSFIRLLDYPVMGNGNYDISANHKTKSFGRYIQNVTSMSDTIGLLKSDLELPTTRRNTVVNIVGLNIDKVAWAKFSHGTGSAIQSYQGGQRENFSSADILNFSY